MSFSSGLCAAAMARCCVSLFLMNYDTVLTKPHGDDAVRNNVDRDAEDG